MLLEYEKSLEVLCSQLKTGDAVQHILLIFLNFTFLVDIFSTEVLGIDRDVTKTKQNTKPIPIMSCHEKRINSLCANNAPDNFYQKASQPKIDTT